MSELKINHLAAIVCIILLHVLGAIWYGPLFGESWMGAIGLTMADAEANPPGAGVWITNFVNSALAVYVLAWLFTRLNVTSAVDGLLKGVLIGAAFQLMPVMAGNMFAMAPYELAWINGGFYMAGWGLCGLILGVWTKKA